MTVQHVWSRSDTDVPETTVKPYKVNDQLVNQEIELKHGESTRRFAMDKISNGPFEEVCTISKHASLLLAELSAPYTERVRASAEDVRNREG